MGNSRPPDQLKQFTLITASTHKLAEWRRLVPSDIMFDHLALELEEIQDLDSKKIITHKVLQAYNKVGKPVIVEDVSAGLDALNGLPGPFIKFFEQQLGKGALHRLAPKDNTTTTVTCTIGYYDGKNLKLFEGTVTGHVVSPKGEAGFGFDFVFVPNGQRQTFAEMGRKKDTVSHRGHAIQKLVVYLEGGI